MLKILAALIVAASTALAGCANVVETEYEEGLAHIVEVYEKDTKTTLMPVRRGLLPINTPTKYYVEIYDDYYECYNTIEDKELYMDCKDCIGDLIWVIYERKTYSDGTIKFKLVDAAYDYADLNEYN